MELHSSKVEINKCFLGGFVLSKTLLSERLLSSDWLDGSVCCELKVTFTERFFGGPKNGSLWHCCQKQILYFWECRGWWTI